MKNNDYSRRRFIKQNSLLGMGEVITTGATSSFFANITGDTDVPAILGGEPIRTENWPKWPR